MAGVELSLKERMSEKKNRPNLNKQSDRQREKDRYQLLGKQIDKPTDMNKTERHKLRTRIA